MSSIQVVTIADKEPSHDYLVRGFGAFKASLARWNHSPLILGWNAPWRGLGSKPKLLKKAIESGQIESDYILLADAFDTVFAHRPEQVLETFQDQFGHECRIVWNAERNCFPDGSLASHHPETKWPYKYFNSGLAIGDTAAFLQILEEMRVDEWPDDHKRADGSWYHRVDQDDLMRKFLHGQCGEDEVKMKIDSECQMFQTLVNESIENFDFSTPKQIKNVLTGTFPSVWHLNGNAKTAGLMEPILSQLNL